MRIFQGLLITSITLVFIAPNGARAENDSAAVYQPCIACHGEAGQGNVELGAPALAGQGAAYLERQLMNFRSGIRGNTPGDLQGAQMKAMADTLAVEDISPMASYLSSLPVTVSQTSPPGDLKNGNNFYQAKCGACHGGQAEGNPWFERPRPGLAGRRLFETTVPQLPAGGAWSASGGYLWPANENDVDQLAVG